MPVNINPWVAARLGQVGAALAATSGKFPQLERMVADAHKLVGEKPGFFGRLLGRGPDFYVREALKKVTAVEKALKAAAAEQPLGGVHGVRLFQVPAGGEKGMGTVHLPNRGDLKVAFRGSTVTVDLVALASQNPGQPIVFSVKRGAEDKCVVDSTGQYVIYRADLAVSGHHATITFIPRPDPKEPYQYLEINDRSTNGTSVESDQPDRAPDKIHREKVRLTIGPHDHEIRLWMGKTLFLLQVPPMGSQEAQDRLRAGDADVEPITDVVGADKLFPGGIPVWSRYEPTAAEKEAEKEALKRLIENAIESGPRQLLVKVGNGDGWNIEVTPIDPTCHGSLRVAFPPAVWDSKVEKFMEEIGRLINPFRPNQSPTVAVFIEFLPRRELQNRASLHGLSEGAKRNVLWSGWVWLTSGATHETAALIAAGTTEQGIAGRLSEKDFQGTGHTTPHVHLILSVEGGVQGIPRAVSKIADALKSQALEAGTDATPLVGLFPTS